MCLEVVLVNEGPEMGPCSRRCATERSVDRVVVNKCFVGCTAVRADSSSGISLFTSSLTGLAARVKTKSGG